MQMFGVGLPELLMILVLAVIVVGPDRLPALAADLARWIRRTRAYAEHLTKDFNEVIGDLEKEVGTTREDWREIAGVVGMHTSQVTKEIEKVTSQLEASGDLDAAKQDQPSNLVSLDARRGDEVAGDAEQSKPDEEEKPWYVPETIPRRRSMD